MQLFGYIQPDGRGLCASIDKKTERTGAVDVNFFYNRIAPGHAERHGITSGGYNRHEHAYQGNSSFHAARITAMVGKSNDGKVIFPAGSVREQ